MRILLFVCIIGVLPINEAFAKIDWLSDLGLAKEKARKEEKLILVVDPQAAELLEDDDQMNGEVSKKLIPVSLNNEGKISIKNVNGIDLISNISEDHLAELIVMLPEHVHQLHTALSEYQHYSKSSNRSTELAKAYQRLAMILPFKYNQLMIALSDRYFEEALQLSKKEKSEKQTQTVQLELGINCVVQQQYNKAIEIVLKDVGLKHLDLSNLALAYYTLASSYEMIGDEKKAELYADKLLLAPGGYEYMAKLKGQRLAPSAY